MSELWVLIDWFMMLYIIKSFTLHNYAFCITDQHVEPAISLLASEIQFTLGE